MGKFGIQDKIKRLLHSLPSSKLPDEDRRKFIAWLYNLSAEKRPEPEHVFAGRPRSFAGATAALVAVLVALTYLLLPQCPYVSDPKGTVKIYRASNNQWVFAERSKIRLYKNDVLKTFQDGQADIVLPNRYHLRLKNDSEIRVASLPSRILPGTIKYGLSKGRVYAYYNKKQALKKEFDIATGEADVSAVGTDFMVISTPALDRTWVGVMDGIVRVQGIDIKTPPVLVEPGEKTIINKGFAPQEPKRLLENELLEMEELYRIGTKPQVALLISTGKTRTRELLSLALLYISSDSRGAFPEKMERVEKRFRSIMGTGAKDKYLENIKEFEEIVDRYPNPKYNIQFLLFIAAYYEYAGEHNKAIETFGKVINDYPRSNLASVAQCAIGIIYEEKLNEPDKAKIAYQKVISSYPRSAEIEEAVSGLARISSKK